jgi:DNA-binding beta-propeller fold protein YncE
VDVDADNNIYVADAARGVLLVFDPQGRFLREMGTFHGETMYEQITAIAIDRKARHLYVADAPAHNVSILDLEGNLLKRVGQGRGNSRPGELIPRQAAGVQEFNHPTDIAVVDGYVAVLDSAGTRVRLMDADGKLRGGFSVQRSAKDRAYGIGINRDGNIYVYPNASSIRVYSAHGQVLGTLGHAGACVAQFIGPAGLWIDGANHLYVADTKNARVELFQLASAR